MSSSSQGTLSPRSDDSTPLLGHEANALIQCNRKLKTLGIDQTIKLPQIVVVGDQSTGKSSLIEAISTIQVPKAKGCCTQCPIAINLSSGANASSPWRCEVSIEENYNFVESLIPKGVTKANPFGAWQKKDRSDTVQVGTTFDKDEVPNLIQTAQFLVLNPGTRLQDYAESHSRDTSPSQTTKFSPNVIKLDVSEGNWPSLSFIDLPGVIANTGREKDKWLVKLIKNLVQQYATAERSVNVLTLPMTHDPENSQACAIIQDLKAEPHTLAVFTKADLADSDQRTQFLRKFVGDDDLGFEHGYHFVVMPDNMGQEEARKQERKVFAQQPWSQLDQVHQSRLGVDALRTCLRRLLWEKTAETLPSNLKSIELRLSQIDGELMSLPAPPNSVLLPLQLQQSVTQFENAIKVLFSGDDASPSVPTRTAWIQATTQFKAKVTKARPTVYLMTRAEEKQLQKSKAEVQELASRTGADTHSNAVEVSSGDEFHSTVSVKEEKRASKGSDWVHRFRLEEIRQINERYYQACVPGEIEPRAVEHMNKLSVEHWDTLLGEFMNKISKLLNTQVGIVAQQVFEKFSHLELSKVVESFIKQHLDEIIYDEWSCAEKACDLEMKKPYTLDVEALKVKESACLEDRRPKRLEKRVILFKASAEARGVSKQQIKKEKNDLGPDPFDTEIQMSAKTRAYYEVASARFIDNICMGVLGRLLPACTTKLVDHLKQHLGLDDPDKHEQIVQWMTENPEREIQRQKLIEERTGLTEGLQYIKDVLGKDSSGSPKRRQRDVAENIEEPQTPSKRLRIARTLGTDTLTINNIPERARSTDHVQAMELDDD